MPRKNLIRQSEVPYHVFTRSNNKDWFQIPMPEMWKASISALENSLEQCSVKIHVFVLMGNHYHMLLSTPGCDLDKFMMNFNKKLSDKINRSSGVINHKFSNRYHWTIVNKDSYLFNIYRYIYQNPVRANLSKRCIDYPYSSLQFTNVELINLNITTHLSYHDFQSWFENRNDKETNDAIRKSMIKGYFKIRERERVFVKEKLREVPS